MATPKLKVGDTFVYTQEMSTATHRRWRSGKDKNRDLIGKTLEVASFTSTVTSNLDCYTVKINGDQFSFVCKDIDWFLPETNPRTLDDVKKGDVLVDRDGAKWVVVARTGQVVLLCAESNAIPWPFTIDLLKERNYKFADQPAERWKPGDGDKYYYVDVDGFVDFSTFDSGVGFKHRTIEIGNCFETAEEAEKAAEELKGWWGNRINNQKLK